MRRFVLPAVILFAMAFATWLSPIAPLSFMPFRSNAQLGSCSLPFTFINGTIADATQVNSNFTAAINCINLSGNSGLPQTVNNSSLKALSAGAVPFVFRESYTSLGDRGGVVYYWSASSSCTDDGGSCIVPNSAPPTGRWLAIFPSTGAPIEAWGAIPGATDVSTPVSNAIAYACANGVGLRAGDGTYNLVAAAMSVTCNINNFSFVGNGPNTIFSYSGTSNIDSILFMDPGSGKNNWYSIIGPFTLTGNSHVNYGLHATRNHHMHANVRARNVAISGVYLQFNVSDVLDISCSNNEGAYTTQPANCLLAATDGVGGGLYDSPIHITAEGVSGSGIKLSTSNNNSFTGTSEGNNRGVELASDTLRNAFYSFDFESNTTQDVLDNGSYNGYFDIISCCTGRFQLSGTASGSIISGGNYDNITVTTGAGTATGAAPIWMYPGGISNTISIGNGTGTDVRLDYVGDWIPFGSISIACGSGSIGAGSSTTGKLYRAGRRLWLNINVQTPNLGTCSGTVTLSLPYTPASGNNPAWIGRDNGNSGVGIVGLVDQGLATVELTKYDGTLPFISGSNINITGWYECTSC